MIIKKCDIVIPVWNQLEATKECLEAIFSNTGYPYRIIAINNGSDDPTARYLDSLKNTPDRHVAVISNDKNLGFVKATNQGVAASDAPLVCLMNNDTIATSGWLEEMVSVMESYPEIGVVNPSSNTLGQYPGRGEKIDSYAVSLGRFKGQVQEMYAARGFCMLIKREVIDKIGFLDETYGLGYFEETDYSARAGRAGFRIVRAKGAYVYHKEETTFKDLADKHALFEANEKVYNRKWGRALNIAFVTRSRDLPEDRKKLLNKLLDAGHNLLVFSDRSEVFSGLIDHINIRKLRLLPVFFTYAVSYKIRERREKKPVDCIVTDDKKLIDYLEGLNFMHGVSVLAFDEGAIMSYCTKKSMDIYSKDSA